MQGSLAYFAKGPLSRARSAFHLDLESSLDMADLIEFLKSMILTTVQIDKKYRETIPDVIAKMGEHINSSDEGGRRKRKSKKMRLGKNGLYPVEEEDVCRWWTSNKPELSDDQTGFSAAQIKSHVSLLRTRETQLQMILILEILALEPLKSSADTGDACLPALPGTDTSVQLPSMAPPPKKRNKHNLPVLIDVHADRLTIWQSTAFDDILLLGDSQVSQVSADGQSQAASSEPLKDFCVDVIVPLYVLPYFVADQPLTQEASPLGCLSCAIPSTASSEVRLLFRPQNQSQRRVRVSASSKSREQRPNVQRHSTIQEGHCSARCLLISSTAEVSLGARAMQ